MKYHPWWAVQLMQAVLLKNSNLWRNSNNNNTNNSKLSVHRCSQFKLPITSSLITWTTMMIYLKKKFRLIIIHLLSLQLQTQLQSNRRSTWQILPTKEVLGWIKVSLGIQDPHLAFKDNHRWRVTINSLRWQHLTML
jgi:hypothetical protein